MSHWQLSSCHQGVWPLRATPTCIQQQNCQSLRVGTIIHIICGHAKYCLFETICLAKIFWWIPGHPFYASLYQSAAMVTGLKLQSVKGQAIKARNFVNTWEDFNQCEYKFVFLKVDMPFSIIGLDFLGFLGWTSPPTWTPALSFIDSVKAFHRVPIAPEDCQKTAVIMPFSLFEFNYMHFGLCNKCN
jgi:hypothetical protein